MTEHRNWEIERLLLEYLDALEIQDWDAYGEIWRQAETDRELETALRELHEGLLAEHAGPAGREQDAEAIRLLAAEHFPQRPEAEEQDELPLTAGDVAARLRADLASGAVRLRDADRQANDRLLGDATLIPDQLKQSVLDAWCARLNVHASREYWRMFRQAALRLVMARSHRQSRMAAARRPSPRKKEPKDE
ncbi:MAG: hypothetical protein KY475_27015 [Planctomycetes bacterium]|nr:hypothetical protein [Planctomycetota bacterium]